MTSFICREAKCARITGKCGSVDGSDFLKIFLNVYLGVILFYDYGLNFYLHHLFQRQQAFDFNFLILFKNTKIFNCLIFCSKYFFTSHDQLLIFSFNFVKVPQRFKFMNHIQQVSALRKKLLHERKPHNCPFTYTSGSN